MRILEGPSRERMLERKPTTDSHLSIVSVCLLNEKKKKAYSVDFSTGRLEDPEQISLPNQIE